MINPTNSHYTKTSPKTRPVPLTKPISVMRTNLLTFPPRNTNTETIKWKPAESKTFNEKKSTKHRHQKLPQMIRRFRAAQYGRYCLQVTIGFKPYKNFSMMMTLTL